MLGRLFRRPICAVCNGELALHYAESATGGGEQLSFEIRPFPFRACPCGTTTEGVVKPGAIQDALMEQRLFVWFGDHEDDTCKRCGNLIQKSAPRGTDEFHLQLSPRNLRTLEIHARLPSITCAACGVRFVDGDTTFVAKAAAFDAAWEQLLRTARASPRASL